MQDPTSLSAALQRRLAVLLDLATRAERMRAAEEEIAAHLSSDAGAAIDALLEEVAPTSDAPLREVVTEAFDLPSRERLRASLEREIQAARTRAKVFGCELDGVMQRHSELESEIESVQMHGRELAISVNTLAKNPVFIRLREQKYEDATGFDFWRFSEFRRRRDANELVEEYGRSRSATSFSELRHSHEEDVRALRTLEGALAATQRTRDALSELLDVSQRAVTFGRDPSVSVRDAYRLLLEQRIDSKPDDDVILALAPEPQIAKLATVALGARARLSFLKTSSQHFLASAVGRLASDVHDIEITLEVLRSGHTPIVDWPPADRVDDDTGEILREIEAKLERFERIRDALVSFSGLDNLRPGLSFWEQMVDFDPGDFIDEVVMRRALATVSRPQAREDAWSNAAERAAERLAAALAETNAAPSDPNDDVN